MVARRVLQIGQGCGLVLFCIAGDHLHLVLLCDRRRAGLCARAIEATITIVCGLRVGFRPARFQRVRGRRHLRALVEYVLGQHAHHAVTGDALLECSNLLDLLWIRQVETGSAARLKLALPELERRDLERLVGGAPVHGTDPSRLIDAATVVTGGLPFLGNSPLAVRARGAIIRCARSLGLPRPAVSLQLGVSNSTVGLASSMSDAGMDWSIGAALGLVQTLAPRGFPGKLELPARQVFEIDALRRGGRVSG
ncbi:MAG: hypothetical protein GY913_22685 [Proteobacteria bacterium]|nr:hypothetical protein [Pseudomonadota bacterium]MCP4919718.1 hypothetical protein [Pseudomonadota bacterium]